MKKFLMAGLLLSVVAVPVVAYHDEDRDGRRDDDRRERRERRREREDRERRERREREEREEREDHEDRHHHDHDGGIVGRTINTPGYILTGHRAIQD